MTTAGVRLIVKTNNPFKLINMSKVLYKISSDTPPPQNIRVGYRIASDFVPVIYDNNKWFACYRYDCNKWQLVDEDVQSTKQELLTHWYSETPSPELAEVIDAINRQKEYFTNQGDSVAVLLKKHQFETLLNELLN